MSRLCWPPIIDRAAEVAGGTLMTLRQCFYILVSEGLIPNTDSSYKGLSRLTAEARREGSFPSFIDGTREIFEPTTFAGVEEAIGDIVRWYRRDRTEGQELQLWIAGEKRTLAQQLHDWFGELGCPIVVCAGYPSQTLCDDVSAHVHDDGREAVLIYAGDFDPSGEDIARDFVERTDAFDEVVRVAVTPEQIAELRLTPMAGKRSDARAGAFVARYGELVQVEVEAVHPDTLRQLYQDAIDERWDTSSYEQVCEQEADERELLEGVLARFADDDEDEVHDEVHDEEDEVHDDEDNDE